MSVEAMRFGPIEQLRVDGIQHAAEVFDFFTVELVRHVALACEETENFGLMMYCEQQVANTVLADASELDEASLLILN